MHPASPPERRSAMIRSKRTLAAAALLAAPAALANDVNVQTFQPTANLKYVRTEGAAPDRLSTSTADNHPNKFFLGVHYNFLNDSLVTLNTAESKRLSTNLEKTHGF